ncbi:MAG: hypothetical protein V3V40_05990 [Nitrosomonadaceae bacterium]
MKNIIIFMIAIVYSLAAYSNSDAQEPMYVPPGITYQSIDDMQVPLFFKNMAKHQRRQMEDQGYIDANNDEVVDMESYSMNGRTGRDLHQMVDIESKLAIIPADLSNTPFAKAVFIGALYAGGLTDGGWSGIERVFRFPKLGLVRLDESDYVIAGGGAVIATEAVNDKVNGAAAVFVVKQTRNKRVVTELMWFGDTKIYTLTTANKMVREDALHKRLISLAESIR